MGQADVFLPLGTPVTTDGGDAFLVGISRLIDARTSPGRPRSSAKLGVTECGIGNIVGLVGVGTGIRTAILQAPGGGGVPVRGSVTSGTVPPGGKGGRKGRRTVPGTTE